MTSVLRSEHSSIIEAESPRIAQEFIGALRLLPEWGRDEALRRLMLVIAQQGRTDDSAVVDHFLRSLLMTAHMEQDPAYLMASAEREMPAEPQDIADVIAGIEARSSDRGA
jgi:hypothetical protein